MEEDSKLRFSFTLDCKSELCRFDATCIVVTMSAKLHRVSWKLVAVKKECFKGLKCIKVDAYKETTKEWISLTFHKILNTECDKEVKKFILSAKANLIKISLLLKTMSPLFSKDDNKSLDSAEISKK